MERVRRRWWTLAVTLVAGLVVFGAVLTALFQLVIMVAPGYREDIADYVSRVAGQPVDIGGVGLGWSGLAPRLDLTDITLYAEDSNDPALSAERLRLGFGLTRLLRGDTAPTRVELSGVQLYAVIDADGGFSLRGLDTGGGPSRASQDWLRQLSRFQRVRLTRCELQLDDARLQGVVPRFLLTQADLKFSKGRGRASMTLALPPAIGSTIELNAEIAGDLKEPQTWNGRWSAVVEGLTGLPWLSARLAPGAALGFRDTELKLDGALEGGRLGPVDLRLDAGELLARKGKHEAGFRKITAQAHLTPQPHGWVADIDRLQLSGRAGPWPLTRVRLALESAPDGSNSLDAAADYLRLEDLVPWIDLLPEALSPGDVERLRGVSGVVRGLVLRSGAVAGGPRFSLRADLEDLAFEGTSDLPGLSGLSGQFSATETSGRLLLRETPFELSYPKVFARSASFEQISGELGWTRTGEGWELSMPRFGWQLAGSRGEGELALLLPLAVGRSPHLNLDVRFSASDVNRLKPYMPLHWGQNLRDWLAAALVKGRSPHSRLRIEGDLADFPFVDQPGLFALDLDVADGQLAFAPDWPALEDLAGHLEFRGKGMLIKGEAGTISGNRVEAFEASIPDFHEAQLAITGEVQGEAGNFYGFLRGSPLAQRLSGLLERTRASGEAVATVQLAIPLHQVHEVQVSGDVRLRGVQLELTGVAEPIRNIQGNLSFDRHGVRATGLAAEMFETPLTAAIDLDEAGVQHLSASADFAPNLEGRGLSALLPEFLRPGLSGSSRWQARLALNGPQSGVLWLDSDLRGLAIALPKPLVKPADEAWPTTLSLQSDASFPMRLGLEMAGHLGADFAFARNGEQHLALQRARLRAGAGPAPHAGEDGFYIVGTVADLEPLRWAALAPSHPADPGGGGAGLGLHADLNVGRLWLGSQMVEGVRLSHGPAVAGWLTRLSGSGAEGDLSLRRDETGGLLTGRFAHVRFAARNPSSEAAAALPAPGSAVASAPEETPEATPPLEPGRLPRLDFDVQELHVGGAALGRLELRTARIADGQRIERLHTNGSGAELDASGEWRRVAGRSSAQLQVALQSDAVGELLPGLGYAASLSARRSRFEARLNWADSAPTAASGLEWGRAEGRLDLELDKGMLRAVEPGAGRVLGLINFWALPRRLTLDFRDVVSQGLGFDQIKGRFSLGGGVATTEDLNIDAPSLNMEVRGRVGLVAHDYDQRVKVYPDVSAGVTLGALLLGGPAAGALALVAQEVLDQPLDQVGQLSYRLTGSWEDPQLVRETAAAEVAPAPPPPPAPAPARKASATLRSTAKP